MISLNDSGLIQVSVDINLRSIGLNQGQLHATFAPAPGVTLKAVDQSMRELRAMLVLCATDIAQRAEAGTLTPSNPRPRR